MSAYWALVSPDIEFSRDALGFYHERKDDVRDVGHGPEHDWSSHVSRKEALSDLNDQLQFAWPAVKYRGNIELIATNYDRLRASARGD
jgi:hypothetical protein